MENTHKIKLDSNNHIKLFPIKKEACPPGMCKVNNMTCGYEGCKNVKQEESWEEYFKKSPMKLSSESDIEFKNRFYTWSRDNFNPPSKK